MAIFVNKTYDGFANQLRNFAQKLPGYQATLGLSAGQVSAAAADAAFMYYLVGVPSLMRTYSENVTAYLKQARYGTGGTTLPSIPAPPALITPLPTLVVGDIEGRFRAIIQIIIVAPGYTTSIGEDLGIEAPVTPFVPGDGKPIFTIELSSGGYPNLKWKKGKFEGVEIWKAVAGGAWVNLERDLRPDYIDKSDLPPAGQSAVWKYKMIYLFKDDVVGSWSDEVAATVVGEV
ncbi:MAG: hypothetical protein SH856_09100 [Flavobacteriales bacterium]|nr:hypothetical protein [Flavobacteriales bacterium]